MLNLLIRILTKINNLKLSTSLGKLYVITRMELYKFYIGNSFRFYFKKKAKNIKICCILLLIQVCKRLQLYSNKKVVINHTYLQNTFFTKY